jgi:uncharacterized protein YjiS (DUF1127 family)
MSRPPLLIIAEAGVVMIIASAAIRAVSFRRLAAAMGKQQSGAPATAEEIARLVRAVRAWSRRLPWRTMCFEEGLSVHWLLRRRGLASTLHYGAATIDDQLKAHVWVRSGGKEVTGCEVASQYALLARFPED